MLLQIEFEVAVENAIAFERMYHDVYTPALRKQPGYMRSTLLRLFPDEIAQEIGAAPTGLNYQLELVFDTEENRRRWVASPEHQIAWPQASALARKAVWRGYDVAGEDIAIA